MTSPPLPQVVQIPIEQCSRFTDCLSCAAIAAQLRQSVNLEHCSMGIWTTWGRGGEVTNNVNPICGWCTVEQKCSRRSQCQNSTVSTRWVQGGTSLCLSNTSVTPTKFVQEMLTNVCDENFLTYITYKISSSFHTNIR